MPQAKLLLRVGLAFVFLYAGISSLISPKDWLWFIPGWIPNIMPREMMLMLHAIFELVLGLWLLSNRKVFWAATIAALDLLIITSINLGILVTVFRDVGLFFMAISLAFLSKDSRK